MLYSATNPAFWTLLHGLTAVLVCMLCQCPGPDILVCDEAHMIKNHKADITQALRQVRTHRRIALTGSPLQNNLIEYYCVSSAVLLRYCFICVLSRSYLVMGNQNIT